MLKHVEGEDIPHLGYLWSFSWICAEKWLLPSTPPKRGQAGNSDGVAGMKVITEVHKN